MRMAEEVKFNIAEEVEFDAARASAWERYKNSDDQYASKRWVFYQGYEAGYHRARAKTTIQLANEFYGNGYPQSWFAPLNWLRRNARLRTFLDQLWRQYGPTEFEDDEC